MSRHRNIRKLNYDEEDDGYDDPYGKSVEDDYCISPSVAEFMYDRNAQQNAMTAYFNQEDIPEEEIPWEETDEGKTITDQLRRSSTELPNLGDIEKARLKSCLEEIRNIVGDSIAEKVLIDAVLENGFDLEKALDKLLTSTEQKTAEPPLPQREGKNRRDAGASQSRFKDLGNPNSAVNNGDYKKLIESVVIMSIPTSTENVKTGFFPNEKSSNVVTISETLPTSEAASSSLDVVASKDIGHLKDLLLEDGNGSASMSVKSTTSRGREASSKVDAEAEFKRFRGGNKDLINLVVIGHVDAGKSTLMGHVLCLLGAVSQKVMHKYEQESKKIGKASFLYAWVLDETGEERTRGVTMDVGYSKFETRSKIVTLLDAPGHKDFIPNMITGAAQADVAVLVVDSTRGEFETGFESGGQTREHALLVRSLGVSQLVVAVNKLENVNWSQDRYDEIVNTLSHFLIKQAGFKGSDVTYIPCSGLTGENLVDSPKEPSLKQWYSGSTLIEQIDNFKSPERAISKPFRFCVSDAFKGQGSTISVAGKIETGLVQMGDKVMIMPSGDIATVRGISMDDASQTNAFAGDQVLLSLAGTDIANVTVGCVVCDCTLPIRTTNRFRARIVVFNIDMPITKGFQAVLHYQSLCEPVIVKKLVSQLNKGTGEVVKNNPRCLTKQTNAIVELEVSRPICVEEYKEIKELGRFMLRSKGTTLAAGVVTQIL